MSPQWPIKTPADYPLQQARQRQTTWRSTKTQIQRLTESLSSFKPESALPPEKQSRSFWWRAIHSSCSTFEERRKTAVELKRRPGSGSSSKDHHLPYRVTNGRNSSIPQLTFSGSNIVEEPDELNSDTTVGNEGIPYVVRTLSFQPRNNPTVRYRWKMTENHAKGWPKSFVRKKKVRKPSMVLLTRSQKWLKFRMFWTISSSEHVRLFTLTQKI